MTKELLFAIKNTDDIINVDDLTKAIKDMNILKKHKYEIWQGKSNGRWYTYFPDETALKGRKLVGRTKKENLEKSIIEYYKNEKSDITFVELYHKWMIYRKSRVSEGTCDRHFWDFEKYYKDCEIISRKIIDITRNDGDEFVLDMLNSYEIDEKEYHRVSFILRDVLRYAEENKQLIEKNPMQGYKPPSNKFAKKPKKDSKTEVFTPEEEVLILNRVNNRKNKWNLAYLSIALNFHLALRVGELCALKWSDITGDMIAIKRAEISHLPENDKKGKKIIKISTPKTVAAFRSIPLSDEAIQILHEIKEISKAEDWYDKNGYIFVGKKGRLTARQINGCMQKTCHYLKIKTRNIHNIRKTVLSKLLDSGMHPKVLIGFSGHENSKTLMEYYYFYRFSDESAKKQFLKAVSQ